MLLAENMTFSTITVDKRCHMELSDSQKTWDCRWLQRDQPDNVRLGFLLMGLYDVLSLKGKKTGNSTYGDLARKLQPRICQMLNHEGSYA